jgi:hypothetical protein
MAYNFDFTNFDIKTGGGKNKNLPLSEKLCPIGVYKMAESLVNIRVLSVNMN